MISKIYTKVFSSRSSYHNTGTGLRGKITRGNKKKINKTSYGFLKTKIYFYKIKIFEKYTPMY